MLFRGANICHHTKVRPKSAYGSSHGGSYNLSRWLIRHCGSKSSTHQTGVSTPFISHLVSSSGAFPGEPLDGVFCLSRLVTVLPRQGGNVNPGHYISCITDGDVVHWQPSAVALKMLTEASRIPPIRRPERRGRRFPMLISTPSRAPSRNAKSAGAG